MTLDEYKALQATSRRKQDFNLRRPGEGEDNAQWKKTYVLKKTAAQMDEEDREDVSTLQIAGGEEEEDTMKCGVNEGSILVGFGC